MKSFTVMFTDTFDIEHEEAVFELAYAQRNYSHTEAIGSSPYDNESCHITYQFKYWHSALSKSKNKQPMTLADVNGTTMFTTSLEAPLSAEASALEIENACINHLVAVTLPSIDPASEVTLPE